MNRKKLLIITAILCVLAIGGGIGFQFYQKQLLFPEGEDAYVAAAVPVAEAEEAQSAPPEISVPPIVERQTPAFNLVPDEPEPGRENDPDLEDDSMSEETDDDMSAE